MARCPSCWRRVAVGAPCAEHNYAPEPGEHSPALLAIIDGVEIEDHLGSGGFANVFRGRRDGAAVAVKIAKTKSPEHIRRFAIEARALRAAGRAGPGLMGEGRTSDGRAYLIMELARGRPLDAILAAANAKTGTLAPHEARKIALAIARCLADIGAVGVAHGDLKPENIFIDEAAARATLIDFGIANPGGGALDEPATLIAGSVEYMAPEQLRGAPPSVASDIYSFGILAYELVTGRVPFVGARSAVEYGHLALRPSPVETFATVSASLAGLIGECLHKEPQRRVGSAAALARALDGPDGPMLAQLIAHKDELLGATGRPVVLLWVGGPVTEKAVRLAAARGASMAREHPGGSVWSMAGADQPLEAALAIAAANPVATQQTIHLARLTARPSRRGVRVFGDALEAPANWLPGEPPSGLLFTEEAATLLRGQVHADQTHAGFYRLAERALETRLVGRDAELAAAHEALARAASGRGPSLVAVIGDSGTGKTRLLSEIVSRCEQRVRFITDFAADDASVDAAGLGTLLRDEASASPLVLVVDDAHRCDRALLDAVEYAALDGEGVALAVVAAATSDLLRARPRFGERSFLFARIDLLDLEADAATELVAEFLAPADYLPAAFLAQVASWAGGNPGLIAEVTSVLKQRGGLVQRGKTSSMTVSSLSLAALEGATSAIEEWLVGEKLAALTSEYAALARVAAVVGAEISSEALEAVLAGAASAGAGSSPVAAGAGLAVLADAGLVSRPRTAGEPWAFRRAAVRAALYRQVDDTQRLALHRLCLAHFEDAASKGGSARERRALADHAEACGEPALAASHYVALGAEALAGHRDVDADDVLTRALDLVLGGVPALARTARSEALRNRGCARYRLHRTEDSLADCEEAVRDAGDDDHARLEALLVAATALDWADRHDEQAAMVERARELAARATPSQLANLASAEGRVHWRRGELALAIEDLTRAAVASASDDDPQTRIGALLLLAPALVFAERLDEAEATFATVIDLCQGSADDFHMATALSNRSYLWSATQATERLLADLDRAVELARRIGQPVLERAASHNLSEYLHWSGETRRALALARRAEELRDRFVEAPQVADPLLLARILTVAQERDEARHWLEASVAARGENEPPTHELFVRALAGALDGDADWGSILIGADALPGEEHIELLVLSALAARSAGKLRVARETLGRARALSDRFPICVHLIDNIDGILFC